MIAGLVVICEGIEILTAALLDDFAELVGHYVFVSLSDGVFPRFFQFLQLGLVAAYFFITFRDVCCVSGLDFFQRGLLGSVVGTADLIRALESHVLKHVCQPCRAHGVLRGTGIHQRKE